MAVTSAQVSVTTAATLLSAVETDSIAGESLSLNNTGAGVVYLGPSGVTTANGFPLAAGALQFVDLQPGDNLYAIVATGTVVLAVLRTGV